MITINLSEFAGARETTRKYLLDQSKTNAALSITIFSTLKGANGPRHARACWQRVFNAAGRRRRAVLQVSHLRALGMCGVAYVTPLRRVSVPADAHRNAHLKRARVRRCLNRRRSLYRSRKRKKATKPRDFVRTRQRPFSYRTSVTWSVRLKSSCLRCAHHLQVRQREFMRVPAHVVATRVPASDVIEDLLTRMLDGGT